MFRLDFQTSLFLLPYVVQDVLAAGGGEARARPHTSRH